MRLAGEKRTQCKLTGSEVLLRSLIKRVIGM